MQIAIFTTFAAQKKEPLQDVLQRVHAGFVAGGWTEPIVRLILDDGGSRISSVERVCKRWPALQRLVRGGSLHNVGVNGEVMPVDFELLLAIAAGVPKSFPFRSVLVHFAAPGFSMVEELPGTPERQTFGAWMRAGVDIGAGHPTSAGVNVKDSWWVNGRERFVAAMRIVEADPAEKRLAAPPPPVAAVYAACGKVRKTIQVPLSAPAAGAFDAVVAKYRAAMPEILARLPHDLPPIQPSPELRPSGPKKPELVRCFGALGYDCRGDSGSFTLHRRTKLNLSEQIVIDVGTWSDKAAAFMRVRGMMNEQPFKATLILSPERTIAGQTLIVSPQRWTEIVENLAALVAELQRTFVPEIEAISGPSPEWFDPEKA